MRAIAIVKGFWRWKGSINWNYFPIIYGIGVLCRVGAGDEAKWQRQNRDYFHHLYLGSSFVGCSRPTHKLILGGRMHSPANFPHLLLISPSQTECRFWVLTPVHIVTYLPYRFQQNTDRLLTIIESSMTIETFSIIGETFRSGSGS